MMGPPPFQRTTGPPLYSVQLNSPQLLEERQFCPALHRPAAQADAELTNPNQDLLAAHIVGLVGEVLKCPTGPNHAVLQTLLRLVFHSNGLIIPLNLSCLIYHQSTRRRKVDLPDVILT